MIDWTYYEPSLPTMNQKKLLMMKCLEMCFITNCAYDIICILPCLDYHSGSLPISLDEDQKTERVNVSMNPEAQNDNHTNMKNLCEYTLSLISITLRLDLHLGSLHHRMKGGIALD